MAKITIPTLGTREAAVKGCVSMIAHLCGQLEETVQYWLDLYYQVRLAYAVEEEHRRAAERLEYCRQKQVKPIGPSEGEEQGAEDAAPEAPAVEPKAEQEPVAERSVTPPPAESVSELEGFELVAAAPKKQGAPKGNTNGADAAKFKRETLERLRKMRQDGLTIAKIVSVSNGSIKEDSVLDILSAKRVPIAVYRLLAAVLDKIEE